MDTILADLTCNGLELAVFDHVLCTLLLLLHHFIAFLLQLLFSSPLALILPFFHEESNFLLVKFACQYMSHSNLPTLVWKRKKGWGDVLRLSQQGQS